MAKHWETIIVSSDTHVPFHSTALHKSFLKLIQDIKPDQFILLGDILDLYSLCSYHQNSLYYLKDISLSDEYKAGNAVLDDYDNAMGNKTKKTFVYGNHESRFFTWIKTGDHSKLGEELISPTTALKLKDRGYDVHDDCMNSYIMIGEWMLMHGQSTSINAANTMLMKSLCNIISGHTHRPQFITRGNYTSISLGTMCDIESAGFSYMNKLNRDSWRNGFLVLMHNTKTGEVIPSPVHASKSGVFYFGSQRYG